jgi:phage FluMu protein Com
MTVTLLGKEYVSEEFTATKALGHNYVEIKRQTLEAPTHLAKGWAHVWYECSRCKDTYDTELVLPEQDHTWGETTYVAVENIKTNTVDGKTVVVLDSNGVPALEDASKDGYYYTTRYCTKDGVEDTASRSEQKVVYAKTGVYGVIIKESGLNDAEIDAAIKDATKYYEPTTQIPATFKNNDIELDNCLKDGYYVVQYYNNNDKPISQETVKVTAHHMEATPVAEFKSEDDQKQCTVTYDENGNLVVTNKSCYLPIDYNEVIHCTAAGCPLTTVCKADYINNWGDAAPYKNAAGKVCTVVSSTAKTAAPSGNHVINTDTRDEVNALIAKTENKDGVLYTDLQTIAKKSGSYITLSADPSDCENGGTVTVSYICMTETADRQTVVTTQEVKVRAKGHAALAPAKENYVAPTCTAEGSYDSVVRCERCNKVLNEERNVKVPRIAHTNEIKVVLNSKGEAVGEEDTTDANNAKQISVVLNGNVVVDEKSALFDAQGKTDSAKTYATVSANIANAYGSQYTVTPAAYSLCDVCGYKVELTKATVDARVTVSVDSVVKESKECQPGKITLTATYTRGGKVVATVTETKDYYSTIEEYRGRKTHTPGLAKKETIDGVEYTVVRCTVCDEIITKEAIATPEPAEVPTATLTETTFAYNGQNQIPSVVVKNANDIVVNSSNYTVSYPSESKYPGKYEVVVTFRNNYSGEATLAYEITKGSSVVSLPKTASKNITSTSYTVKAEVVSGNKTGKFSYTSSNEEVATVTSWGKITFVGVGTTTITATMKESTNYKAASATMTLTVKPAPTAITSLTNNAAGSLNVKWRTTEDVDGYQIQYATKADMSNCKYAAVTSGNSYTRKDVTKGQTYYVRVRTFSYDAEGNRVYSNWSGTKNVSIAK